MSTETMFTIPVVRGISTNVAATTAQTLVASDSGMMFMNNSTGAMVYTLPTVALGKGKLYWFMNANTTGTLAITAPTTSMVCNDNGSATTNTSIAVAGLWAMVVCDGTNYFCFEGGSDGTEAAWTAS